MKKIHILQLLVVGLLAISCQMQKETKPSEKFLQAGSKNLQVIIGGSGKNTIVFETGLGMDDSTWITPGIFDSLVKDNQVILYNRSGYGKSTLTTEKRGMQELANDLETVINSLSRNNKVILVGHSLGGSIIRTYAVQHPQKVQALLFIDPNTEDFTEYASMSQADEDTLTAQFRQYGMEGAARETGQLRENVDFLRKLAPLPDVPVIVLTSIRVDDEITLESVQDWEQAHAKLGEGVHHFTHLTTNQYGHFIYLENPGWVLENIRKLRR